MSQPDLRYLMFAALAIVVSVVTELRSGKILNVVTFPALALTLVLKTLMFGLGAAFGSGLVSSLLGAIAYPAVFLFVFRLLRGGGLGMGAVKLMAVLGAGVGFRPALVCAAVSLVVGMGYALFVVWHFRDGKKRKVLGSSLVAAGWLIGLPIALRLGW